MSKTPEEPEAPPDEQSPPDGRGPRPTDPNELAKWIVEQTTREQSLRQRKERPDKGGGEDQPKRV